MSVGPSAESPDDDLRQAALIFLNGRTDDPVPPAPEAGSGSLVGTSSVSAVGTVADAGSVSAVDTVADAGSVSAVGTVADAGSVSAVDTVADAMHRIELAGGETLFSDLDDADALYVVIHGRLRVHRDGAVLAEIGSGQIVGERALLTGEPRRGSVTAVRDAVLYRLSRDDFDRFCFAHPSVMRTMLSVLAQRIGDDDQPVAGGVVPTNLVVVPVGNDSPAADFAQHLSRFLDRYVPTALVTAAEIDQSLGSGAAAASDGTPLGDSVRRALVELEGRHRHLVALADEHPTAWTQRVLRQADQVLLVGRAGRAEAPNPTERWLAETDAGMRAPQRLVVVQGSAVGAPRGTRRWLVDRAPDDVHHVHLGDDGHLARLVRHVAGTPLGLVLSGGASRGLAHIGVLRALDEHKFPIDVVSGTSAGAVIGALLGMGCGPAEIRERIERTLVDLGRKVLDFTIPYTSMIGAARFTDAVNEMFGVTDIEDLWLTYLCVTTDLTAAAGRTHRTGRLSTAVRASCSVPLVMPPVVDDGHLLADGAIINNIPVDPLLEVTDVGGLVVVNVTEAFFTADEPYNYVDRLPLRRVLSGRFNPFSEPLVAPKMFDLLMRSLELGSKSLEADQFAKADLYVRPDVSSFGYTDADHVDDMIDVGYHAAISAIESSGLPAVPFGPGGSRR